METDMSLKMKLVEMHADVETGQSRWVMAIIVVALLFIMTLVVYTLPVMEYVTQTERTAVVAVTGQTGHDITVLEVAGLPYTFTATFSVEFDTERSTKNDWAYIYIFKDVNPGDYFASDMPGDDQESLNRFLKTLEDNSIRHKKLTFTDTDVEWTLAWRDCDTTTFYIVIYNPIQYPPVGGESYQSTDTAVWVRANYDPLMPLIPLSFLFLVVITPVGILRIYFLQQRKKELRIQMSIDTESLSNEDKRKLGIPITHEPSAPAPVQAAGPAPAPVSYSDQVQMVPGQMPEPTAPPPTTVAPSPSKAPSPASGFMTPDDL